jgi:hypothetical protein
MYQAFGLRIQAPFDLPELHAASTDGPADVQVRLASVPDSLSGGVEAEPGVQVTADAALIMTPVARMLVRAGDAIDIDAFPGASDTDVRLYLLGPALSLLCLQRGLLPLHASAVVAGDDAIAFVGPSGAGKSTLAAQFQAAGFQVLCDDLCAIAIERGGAGTEALARVGVGRLKLSSHSLHLVGGRSDDLAPVGAGVEKFSVPARWTADERFCDAAYPVRRIYILRDPTDRTPGVGRLDRLEATAAVIGGLHRWPTAVAMGKAEALFGQVSALVRVCAAYEVVGSRDGVDASPRFDAIAAEVDAERPRRVEWIATLSH